MAETAFHLKIKRKLRTIKVIAKTKVDSATGHSQNRCTLLKSFITMNMKNVSLLFIAVMILFNSCGTKQILNRFAYKDLSQIKRIFVIKNDSSNIIPLGVVPKYQVIDGYVIKKEPAKDNISGIICYELRNRKISCERINDKVLIGDNDFHIEYQDYWTWDFKEYMHVLIIRLYQSDVEIRNVVSQGNISGMHNYPNPEKQIPTLIDLLLKE